MEPPDDDLLTRIVKSYSGNLWYSRVNVFQTDHGVVLNCYLSADTSDPAEVVYHNRIRMKSKVGCPKAEGLMRILSESVRSSKWIPIYPETGDGRWIVSQADAVKSPWSVIDVIETYGTQHAWESKHHYFDVDHVRTLHLRFAYAMMTMQAASSGDVASAFDATRGLWSCFGPTMRYDLQPIRDVLTDVTPRDVVEHLSMIKRVRFSWE